MSSFKGLKDVVKKALLGCNKEKLSLKDLLKLLQLVAYSYAGIEDYEGTTVVANPITLAPTEPGQPKRLWAMEAIDLEITTTPDYNRLVLQQALGNLFD